MSSKIKIPVYDGTKSFAKYLDEVEKFKIAMNSQKYTIVISFINDWLKLKNKNRIVSFIDFKNIKEKYMINDAKHNKIILLKYGDLLKKKCNPKINKKVKFTERSLNRKDDESINLLIIYFFERILKALDYKLINKEIDNELFFSVKKN